MESKPIFEVSIALEDKSDPQGRKQELGLSHLFYANDHDDAIRGAIMWGLNRAKALETSLWCVKVHAIQIPSLQPSGYLPSMRFPFHLFEWKYDTGMPLETLKAKYQVTLC